MNSTGGAAVSCTSERLQPGQLTGAQTAVGRQDQHQPDVAWGVVDRDGEGFLGHRPGEPTRVLGADQANGRVGGYQLLRVRPPVEADGVSGLRCQAAGGEVRPACQAFSLLGGHLEQGNAVLGTQRARSSRRSAFPATSMLAGRSPRRRIHAW